MLAEANVADVQGELHVPGTRAVAALALLAGRGAAGVVDVGVGGLEDAHDPLALVAVQAGQGALLRVLVLCPRGKRQQQQRAAQRDPAAGAHLHASPSSVPGRSSSGSR